MMNPAFKDTFVPHLMANLVIPIWCLPYALEIKMYISRKMMCITYCIAEKQLIDMMYEARLTPQSPTKVCVKCYDKAKVNNNTRWLPWLECARPTDHAKEERITVTVGDNHMVVRMEEIPSCLLRCPPSQLSLCKMVNLPKGCTGDCNSAHSNEELEYWKWSIVHNAIQQAKVMSSYLH